MDPNPEAVRQFPHWTVNPLGWDVITLSRPLLRGELGASQEGALSPYYQSSIAHPDQHTGDIPDCRILQAVRRWEIKPRTAP